MRRNARKDSNQTEIVDALRDIPGVSVAITHQLGYGFPDIVVGYRGRNLLVEIKPPGGELNDNEEDFHRDWRGRIITAHSVDPIIEWINSIS